MTGIEIALALALAGASTADGLTSKAAIRRCAPYCVEGNPLMRGSPFWVAQAGITTGMIALTHEMKARKTRRWWLPVGAGIGIHVFAAQHNTRQ
jgi:hypothetical protein